MKHTHKSPQTSAPASGLRVGLAIAALASVAIITGCGKSTEVASNDDGETRVATVMQTSSQVPASPAVAPSLPSGRNSIVALGDSLPPEVSASVADSLIHPGDVVEITAEGSDDASQVTLSDGLGRMQLFKRDPASNTWRVLYRVPLHSKGDQVALSVTALNDVNRWRRVWLFLDVPPQRTPSVADSLAK